MFWPSLTQKMKNYNVRFLPDSLKDIKDARAWYRKKNPDLPIKLKQQLNITVEKLCSLPVSHAIRYKDVRIAHLAVFPYSVHYILKGDNIVILAIYHNAINPNKWMERYKNMPK